jgi:HPt (histidine-containing phosphotransfer) domain-containing protein
MSIWPADQLTVTIDNEIEPVMPVFFKCRREDLVAIDQALANGDYQKIKGIGHKIKGAGGSFGFDAIYRIGKEIEAAAEVSDHAGIAALRGKLTTFLEQVNIIYV